MHVTELPNTLEAALNRPERLHAMISDSPCVLLAYFIDKRAGDELAKLPEHMRCGMARYVICGIKPGAFLCSVLADEFELAERRGDPVNLGALPAYREFLRSVLPREAWGSSKRVQTWCETGGLWKRRAAA